MPRKQNFETPVLTFSFRILSSSLVPLFLPSFFFARHLGDFISVGIVYGKVFSKDLKGWVVDQDCHKNVKCFLPFFTAWHGLKDLFILHKLDGKPLP